MFTIFALILAFSGNAAPSTLPTTMCRAAEPIADDVKAGIIRTVTATDSLRAAVRDSSRLPHVPADSVSFVSDSTVCAAAASAYASAHSDSTTTATAYPVWVIRVGPTRYVVFNPEYGLADRLLLSVFDAQFAYLRTLVE